MNKKLQLKASNRKSMKVKRITLKRKDARISVSLGNGFDRWDFFQIIAPNTLYTFTFYGNGLKPISAGWWNIANIPFIISSYPSGINNWIVRVRNTTTQPLNAAFFFVTKT